jgi:hypothetical protein
VPLPMSRCLPEIAGLLRYIALTTAFRIFGVLNFWNLEIISALSFPGSSNPRLGKGKAICVDTPDASGADLW